MPAITRTSAAQYLYLFGLFLLAASLPFSKFLMSNAQIILLFSWLLDGNLISKLKSFAKNKIALAISSIYILHLIGLLYTSDFDYGLNDVKIKVPLLLLPLIISTAPPVSNSVFEKILSVFVLSVAAASFICFYVLLGYSGRQVLQARDASIFTSHIRFGLMMCLSVFILGYFIYSREALWLRALFSVFILWFILFMLMMESETGLACTAAASFILIIRLIFQTKKIAVKISFAGAIILACIGTYFYLSSLARENSTAISINKKNLPSLTKNGNTYSHDTLNSQTENGNYVWLCVCEKELADEWNKRSRLDFSGKDLKGNELKYTAIRFLASKGLTKDSSGAASLSEKEIGAIEKGIANVNDMAVFNPSGRIKKIMWELNIYLHGGNPTGYSVAQRFEFWKTGAAIMKENLLFGVGTGDTQKAFKEEYSKMNSPLDEKWRLRSHNQFLAIGTAFGIIGLIWFLISLFYPLFAKKNYRDYFYLVFFVIAVLSMTAEDTLETQAGVTFFSFFSSLFLFARKRQQFILNLDPD